MSAGKSPVQFLIDEANLTNESNVPYNAVDIGTVEPNDGEGGNTRVLASAVSGMGYKGEVLFTYNRLDIAQVFEQNAIENVELETSAERTRQLVALLQDAYGLVLDEADVVDEQIEYDINSNAVVVLKIANSSYIYTGELPIDIRAQEAGDIALEDVFKITALNGLNYPTLSVQGLTKPEIQQNQTVEGQEVKEDNTLHIGTNNPANNFVRSSNSELSLAITARRHLDPETIAAEDGTISIELQPNQDWNFPFSIAVDPKAEVQDRPLTNLYEIYLSAQSLDSGEELVLELVPTASGYSLKNSDKEIDITDSFVSENKQVVQNIQRLSLYKEAFPSAQYNESNALVGNFKLTLAARRKNSLAPRVTATVNVAVTQAVQPS